MPTPVDELWSSLAITHVDSRDIKAMPVILQSTINLLETELAKARAALREIQPDAAPVLVHGDEIAVGAVAAYRQNLIGRAPEFFYGSRRLSPKEVGLVPAVREVSPDEDDTTSPELSEQGLGTISVAPRKRVSLVDVLSNSLILDHMAPYFSASSLFTLASTSRLLRAIVLETPYVFRHLDLTHCRGAYLPAKGAIDSDGGIQRSGYEDDSLTEDDFYSAPLSHVFEKLEHRSILQDVRTLVLDGLAVPADLVADIILNERFNVSILSIRDCRHLNERKLMQVLQYAVRPSRPPGTPRIKGIYHFTPVNHARAMVRSKYRDWWSSRCAGQAPCGAMAADKAVSPHDQQQESPQYCQNAWYRPSGRLFQRSIEEGWAQTIQRCEGVIAFDAVLCRGPRHDAQLPTPSTENQGGPQDRLVLGPAIATIALGPDGCDGCHASPEGPAIWGQSPPERFPLLTPPPLHSSSVVAAKRPALFPDEHPAMVARCADCLNDRWCHRCNKWFCTSCLPHPERVSSNLSPHQTAVRGRGNGHGAALSQEPRKIGPGVSKDCWECGPTCAACKVECQRTCQNCRGDYCIEHNEGCSSTMCDWCNTSTRHRMREIY